MAEARKILLMAMLCMIQICEGSGKAQNAVFAEVERDTGTGYYKAKLEVENRDTRGYYFRDTKRMEAILNTSAGETTFFWRDCPGLPACAPVPGFCSCCRFYTEAAAEKPSNYTFRFRSVRGPSLVNVTGIAARCGDAATAIALGPKRSALPRQLSAYAKLPPKFAYCLAPKGVIYFGAQPSQYTFSSTSKKTFIPSLAYSPLSISSGYSVQVTGLAFDDKFRNKFGDIFGNTFSTSPPKALSTLYMASDSTYSTLQNSLYRPLRQHFLTVFSTLNSSPLPNTTFQNLTLCYKIPSSSFRKFPSIHLQLSGKNSFSIRPRNYLVPTNTASAYCLGFVSGSRSVLGTFQQQNVLVEFDVGKKLFGISESLVDSGTDCSKASVLKGL